jgi:hypothetical protein
MWQFITVEARGTLSNLPVRTTRPRKIGIVTHGLTHRRYEFEVFACDARSGEGDGDTFRWASLDELDRHPLPKPHLTVARMLSAVAAPF